MNNNLLDIAGSLLYIAFRIILLPVFVALDCFLGAWIALKFINRLIRNFPVRARKKRTTPSLQLKRTLVFPETKFSSVH